jgi:hypothetical protein
MSHVFTLSDEQYQIVKAAADAAGRTPEELFLAWAMEEETQYRNAHPTYFETDDWLRHLGVSEERIQRVNAALAANDENGPDADA